MPTTSPSSRATTTPGSALQLTTPTRHELATVSETQRAQIERSLKRLDALARLMDDQFEIPIVKVRFGLDPLIGMIPGGGDWATWLVGVYIFWEAARLGAPTRLLLIMAWHIGFDLLLGYAPGVGDVLDVIYRSNRRNVQLLRVHFGAAPELGSPLPVHLPKQALAAYNAPPWAKYALVATISLILLAIASGPFLILYFIFQGA